MPAPQTVQMIRNALPLMEVILGALQPFPQAAKAVVDAVAAAEKPRNETAEVHVDEVENWKARGWEVARDQEAK